MNSGPDAATLCCMRMGMDWPADHLLHTFKLVVSPVCLISWTFLLNLMSALT